MSTVAEPPGSGDRTSASDRFSRWVEQLSNVGTNAGDAERIDQIGELERLKSACAARQAVLTAAFVESQTEGLRAAKARDEHTRRSIAAQVALARKDSPVRGNRHVGMAKALTREMPNTLAALQAGEISEWRATLLVRETACLSVEHRRQVDAELAGKLAGLGDKAITQAAAKIAQRLDIAACVKRNRKAVSERRVSIRPAPDTMTYVSALLPVAHGVAVWAALNKHADSARATGDARSRGQVMADEFVDRITKPATAVTDAIEDDEDSGAPGSGTSHDDGPDSSTGADEADGVSDRPGTRPGSSAGADEADGVHDRSKARTASSVGTEVVAVTDPADRQTPSCSDTANANANTNTDQAADVAAPAGTRKPAPKAGAYGGSADATSTNHPGPSTGTDGAATPPANQPWIPTGVNLDIQLVMTDRTLFDGDNEPAHLVGYGPIPAPLARQLIRDASPKTKAWIRRLYTDPSTGQLINGDVRRRFFGHPERTFFIARDQFCRRPYCGAPIRHSDHVQGHAGGPDDLTKGQGLCENCNYSKEAPGWTSRVEPGSDTITITTPTGHTYASDPPAPPRSASWTQWGDMARPTAETASTAADSSGGTPTTMTASGEDRLLTAVRDQVRRLDVMYPEIRWGLRFEVA